MIIRGSDIVAFCWTHHVTTSTKRPSLTTLSVLQTHANTQTNKHRLTACYFCRLIDIHSKVMFPLCSLGLKCTQW